MAFPKSSFHARSISLPSASQSHDANIEDHLRRLRGAQVSLSSSSSLCQSLFAIRDLYEQMNNSIPLSHNLKSLCREEIEEVLEGSLALLDASSSALEALSQMKESILGLKSAIRRGSEDEGVNAYLMSRKKIIKLASKCIANLKKAEKSCTLKTSENDTNIVKMLKEAQVMSLSTLKSVFSYAMGKKGISQTRGWSLVAKLVKSKNVSHDTENATEVEEVDRSLSSLSVKLSGSETKVELLKQLETTEMVILELEGTTESVSRCFVKTRVSLLNVLN